MGSNIRESIIRAYEQSTVIDFSKILTEEERFQMLSELSQAHTKSCAVCQTMEEN